MEDGMDIINGINFFKWKDVHNILLSEHNPTLVNIHTYE